MYDKNDAATNFDVNLMWIRCEINGKKCNLRQKWKNNRCQCECKELCIDKLSGHVKHWTYEKYYTWNASTCVYECDQDCVIAEYVKRMGMHENHVDDLVIA